MSIKKVLTKRAENKPKEEKRGKILKTLEKGKHICYNIKYLRKNKKEKTVG